MRTFDQHIQEASFRRLSKSQDFGHSKNKLKVLVPLTDEEIKTITNLFGLNKADSNHKNIRWISLDELDLYDIDKQDLDKNGYFGIALTNYIDPNSDRSTDLISIKLHKEKEFYRVEISDEGGEFPTKYDIRDFKDFNEALEFLIHRPIKKQPVYVRIFEAFPKVMKILISKNPKLIDIVKPTRTIRKMFPGLAIAKKVGLFKLEETVKSDLLELKETKKSGLLGFKEHFINNESEQNANLHLQALNLAYTTAEELISNLPTKKEIEQDIIDHAKNLPTSNNKISHKTPKRFLDDKIGRSIFLHIIWELDDGIVSSQFEQWQNEDYVQLIKDDDEETFAMPGLVYDQLHDDFMDTFIHAAEEIVSNGLPWKDFDFEEEVLALIDKDPEYVLLMQNPTFEMQKNAITKKPTLIKKYTFISRQIRKEFPGLVMAKKVGLFNL